MKKGCCAISGVFAALVFTSAARAGIIDDFSQTTGGAQFLTAPGPPLSNLDNGPLPGVFGAGSRELQLTVVQFPGGSVADTRVLPASGVWATSNDDGANSIAHVIYKSSSGIGDSLGTPSDTLFRATVTFANLLPDLKATLTDATGHTAEFIWYDLKTGDVLDSLLDDFVRSNLAFDFTKVTGINVEMSGPADWDGSLGLLETTAVPEPASLLLGLAVTGVVGLTAARRRRKQA